MLAGSGQRRICPYHALGTQSENFSCPETLLGIWRTVSEIEIGHDEESEIFPETRIFGHAEKCSAHA